MKVCQTDRIKCFFVVFFLFFVFCRLLFANRLLVVCLFFVIVLRSSLFVVCSRLFVVCCLLSVVCCLPFFCWIFFSFWSVDVWPYVSCTFLRFQLVHRCRINRHPKCEVVSHCTGEVFLRVAQSNLLLASHGIISLSGSNLRQLRRTKPSRIVFWVVFLVGLSLGFLALAIITLSL